MKTRKKVLVLSQSWVSDKHWQGVCTRNESRSQNLGSTGTPLSALQNPIGERKLTTIAQRTRLEKLENLAPTPGDCALLPGIVSKVAISKKRFEVLRQRRLYPQPNAFWTVKMQLVKRVRAPLPLDAYAP
jgi:hypothetical protein